MTINLKVNDLEITDISTVIVSLRNVVFDYKTLLPKEIGYIAQSLAEKHSSFQGELFRTRAMITKILGADPETGIIDNEAPIIHSLDNQLLTLASGVLLLNNVDWFKALNSTFLTFQEMYNTLDFSDHLEPIVDNINFISNILSKTQVFFFCNRSFENVNSCLNSLGKEFNDSKVFHPDFNISGMAIDDTQKSMHSEEIRNISLDNTIIISDVPSKIACPYYQKMKKIFINRNNFAPYFFNGYNSKLVVESLKEIELF